jgi:hypothetical protein
MTLPTPEKSLQLNAVATKQTIRVTSAVVTRRRFVLIAQWSSGGQEDVIERFKPN